MKKIILGTLVLSSMILFSGCNDKSIEEKQNESLNDIKKELYEKKQKDKKTKLSDTCQKLNDGFKRSTKGIVKGLTSEDNQVLKKHCDNFDLYVLEIQKEKCISNEKVDNISQDTKLSLWLEENQTFKDTCKKYL